MFIKMSYIHITVTATTLENHFLGGESTVTFCIGSIDIYCKAPPNVTLCNLHHCSYNSRPRGGAALQRASLKLQLGRKSFEVHPNSIKKASSTVGEGSELLLLKEK